MMDTAAIASIVEAIAKSSSAFLFVAVYIAYRASQTALEAVATIKRMCVIMEKAAPAVDDAVEKVDDIYRRTAQIDQTTSSMNLRLAAQTERRATPS